MPWCCQDRRTLAHAILSNKSRIAKGKTWIKIIQNQIKKLIINLKSFLALLHF